MRPGYPINGTQISGGEVPEEPATDNSSGRSTCQGIYSFQSLHMNLLFRGIVPISMLLLAASISRCHGKYIDIIGQQHRVWGIAAGTETSGSFDITSSSPIGYHAEALWWDEGYYSQENPGTNRVSAAAGEFAVSATDRSCWTFTGSRAFAQSEYRFRPRTEQITLSLSGQVEMHAFENEVWFSLADTTYGYVLAEQSWTTEYPSWSAFEWTGQFYLDPDHEYCLTLYANVWTGDTPWVTSELEAVIIPEAATIVLLGWGSLWSLRHRRRQG